MRILTFNGDRPSDHTYSGDIDRLQQIAAEHGCVLMPADAERVWESYSDTFAAGWLVMDEYTDAELWHVIESRTR